MRLVLVVVLWAACLAGCLGDFDPASYLTGLRVLGVKAEPPEVAPGETATLTPIIFGIAPTVKWSLCTRPPLPGAAVATECFDSDLGDASVPLGEGPTMQVTMPDLRPEQLGLPDYTGGVYLPVILRVSDGAATVTSVYRLRYASKTLPRIYANHNPHIEDVLIAFEKDAGTRPLGDLEIHAGDRVSLRAQLPASDHEQYPQIEGALEIPDGGVSLDGGVQFFDGGLRVDGITLKYVNETLKVSWFADIGRLDPDITGAAGKLDTTLYLDKHLRPPPTDIDLYVVVRDDRGGLDFTRRTLLLR
jgi:hypothetical protein